MSAIAASSRWTGARLWVYTVPAGQAPCSIIVRQQFPRFARDVMIARAGIDHAPGSRASQDPQFALCLSLIALCGRDMVIAALCSTAPPEAPEPPVGATGATVTP